VSPRQIPVWLWGPVQRVLGSHSTRDKRPEREAHQQIPSSAEVKNGATPPLFRKSSWRCAQLIKHRYKFIFTYYPHVLQVRLGGNDSTSIQEFSLSNLGWYSDYTYWGFLWDFLFPSTKSGKQEGREFDSR
jgi:hypothetical protein